MVMGNTQFIGGPLEVQAWDLWLVCEVRGQAGGAEP